MLEGIEKAAEVDRLTEAVDRFAAKMKAKLLAKIDEGFDGWDSDDFVESGYCLELLQGHVGRLYRTLFEENDDRFKQAVDVANLAMFLDAYHERHKDDE